MTTRSLVPGHVRVLLGLSLGLFAGCAPTAGLKVWKPAECDIVGIQRLAVLDLAGPDGSGPLAKAAISKELFANGHYQLVDQAELDGVAPVTDPRGDAGANVTRALEAARVLGVDAVLTGQVTSYSTSDDKSSSQSFDFSQSKQDGVGLGFENNQTLSRQASVALTMKLIDARTGQVRAVREIRHDFNGQVTNGQGYLPSGHQALADLMDACARDAARVFAPHVVNLETKLATCRGVKGAALVRQGNGAAKIGDWDRAAAAWEAALKENPGLHQARHNLALAHAMQGRFDVAREHAAAAQRGKAEALYGETLARIERVEQDNLQVALQRSRRPLANPGFAVQPASARR